MTVPPGRTGRLGVDAEPNLTAPVAVAILGSFPSGFSFHTLVNTSVPRALLDDCRVAIGLSAHPPSLRP
jgi:hypothetical protein